MTHHPSLIVCCLLLTLSCTTNPKFPNGTPIPTPEVQDTAKLLSDLQDDALEARVVRVTDGDTIEVLIANTSVTERVRYLAIDTPETVDPQRSVACFGPEASARNRELVDGRTVQLEIDQTDRDRFGRLLRYVYIDGQMVNGILVEEGYAEVILTPPDTKYYESLRQVRALAVSERRGRWGACLF